jgi:hypothetical protein
MATETKTETKADAKASTKVIALIVAVAQATVESVSRKRALAEGIAAEASRNGYDKKQAGQMVSLSYVEAFKMDKATDAERAKFLLKIRPDVSKVLALAFPEKPDQLAAAYAHNDKLGNAPKSQRIGENMLLEIARGNVTAKQAIAGKQPTRQGSNVLDQNVTPAKRFENSVAGILAMHKIGAQGRLTVEDAREAFERALAAYAGTKTAQKPRSN